MSDRLHKGMLITIEGIDGCGKSSAARALAKALEEKYEVLLTKEPGGTALGLQLRKMIHERTFTIYPEAEFLLFAADRAQHVQEVLLPALRAGKIVIADRSADSSRAYQGFGRQLGDEWIKRVCQWTMKGITPDVTLYLKTDYKTALSRMAKRNEQATFLEKEGAAFFERIIDGFETIFKERSSVIVIDAHEPEEKVHQTMIEKVTQFAQL